MCEAEPAGQHLQVEPAERGEGDDLEHRVDRDQHGGRLPVAAGQVVPDQHHRDAPGQPDDDQAGAVRGLVGENSQARVNISAGPITQLSTSEETEQRRSPVIGAHVAVADLGQHRVHHQQQPDGDREATGVDLDGFGCC